MKAHSAAVAATTVTRGASISVRELTRTYGEQGRAAARALDRVSLDIPASQVVCVVGPSGSGKSTLLHLLGAMDQPDAGTVTVDGVQVSSLPRRRRADYRRRVGFIFQGFHLLPALPAIDNVLAPLVPYGIGRAQRGRARELLQVVGLGDRVGALPSALSGGEQQRVAVARALVNAPPLLLADEPTGSLDSVTGSEIVQLLLQIRDQQGTTVVVTTHDQQLAARCDRVIRLRDGQVADDIDVPRPARPPRMTDVSADRPRDD